MSVTDFLELNKSELFAKIRGSLPVNPQSQNLLECKDDLLFAWDSGDSCLLVTNWRATLLEKNPKRAVVHYQSFIPSTPISFDVSRITISNESSLVALSGSRGVVILELPQRWGADGYFVDGKLKITCRTYCLDGMLFANNPHLEVRQVRWHPESTTDSHLLVLLNNNTIRKYNHAKLRHVWQIGPTIVSNKGNTSLSDFGEVAVDFDIAPAIKPHSEDETPKSELNTTGTRVGGDLNQSSASQLNKSVKQTKEDKIEWPIVILRENGNIYVLLVGMDSDRSRLQGPITITPQKDDNYGAESCALVVIPSLPTTLIIAESNGKLHHALLLEAEESEYSFNEVDEFIAIEPAEWTVSVLETVELELGLPKSKSNSNQYNCPIFLKRDFINELRYFAYHDTGLHVITVNFIAELQRFLDSEAEDNLLTVSTSSSAEYIVCTKVDSSERINPVLGIALLQKPAGVVLLLGSGQVISLKLVIDPKMIFNFLDTTPASAGGNESIPLQEGPTFLETIKTLLHRTVNQPILSADKLASPSPHDRYELLNQAIEVLRAQYLKRHQLVYAEFVKRINRIRLMKEQQLQEIKSLEQEREIISERAHKLADRFEEVSDNQELLSQKCHKLIQTANATLPNSIVAEKEFSEEVARINQTTKGLAAALDAAKKSMNKQRYQIAKSQEMVKGDNFELPEKQSRTINEILNQLTIEIDRQINDVKRINSIIGI